MERKFTERAVTSFSGCERETIFRVAGLPYLPRSLQHRVCWFTISSFFALIIMKHIAFAFCIAAPLALASCSQSPAPTGASQSSLPNVIAPSANYHANWSNQPAFIQQALAVQDQHTPDLMAIPGVIGTGTGLDKANPGQAAILVFTEHPGVAGIPAVVGEIGRASCRERV